MSTAHKRPDLFALQFAPCNRNANANAISSFLAGGGVIQKLPDSRMVNRIHKAIKRQNETGGKVLLDLTEF